MARSITLNLAEYNGVLPHEDVEIMLRENFAYPDDVHAAIALAKARGLMSCTISVARTPTPGSDDEVVDISVRGVMRSQDFNDVMRRVIQAGPDNTTAVWEADHGQHTGTDELPDQRGG